MTEDIRDLKPAASADAGPELPVPLDPAVAVPEEVSAAENFAAETVNAERLQIPEAPDYKDRWLRAEAELQNFRRRAARDRDEAVRANEDRILIDVIEALDDLERAFQLRPGGQAESAWAQGVTLTAQRMRDTLARRGVTPIETLGLPFDPAFHEALLEVPASDEVAPGRVAQEVLRGYRRGDRALRAARVVVARADG